ncbi:MAG: hypothetical protein KKA55_02980 [Proteobacteria bacterium]|nr:hypothetical protein [Pseudomonadota bacterium]MBU1594481.1 hypothetical protein [Pseudomonadota bacterium]
MPHRSRKGSAQCRAKSSAPVSPSAPHHPVGLLYTMLRHGVGLSHEEAARRSALSISAHSADAQSVEATLDAKPWKAA